MLEVNGAADSSWRYVAGRGGACMTEPQQNNNAWPAHSGHHRSPRIPQISNRPSAQRSDRTSRHQIFGKADQHTLITNV